jgi:hypothetical protein
MKASVVIGLGQKAYKQPLDLRADAVKAQAVGVIS